MKNIILASQSPRRKELMALLPYGFEIDPSKSDEVIDESLSPQQNVMRLARQKAAERAPFHRDELVIGCDTVVAVGEEILGKPKDRQDALRMLSLLSGKTHSVFTGVCIADGKEENCFFEETKVTMTEISEEEAAAYVESGEPFDKAGAYAIQGLASIFISKIEGDYFNVVGLPVCRLYGEIKKIAEDKH